MESKERVLASFLVKKPDNTPFIELAAFNIFGGIPYKYKNTVNL